jgi:hypothetical protein
MAKYLGVEATFKRVVCDIPLGARMTGMACKGFS